jgi:hypothetical protein
VLIRSASNRKHKRWQAGLVGIGDDGLALAAAASIRDVQMYSRADMKSARVHVLKVETQIHCEDRWKKRKETNLESWIVRGVVPTAAGRSCDGGGR